MCFKMGRVRTGNATILKGSYCNLSIDNNRHGCDKSKSANLTSKFIFFVQNSLNLSKENSMNNIIFGTNFWTVSTTLFSKRMPNFWRLESLHFSMEYVDLWPKKIYPILYLSLRNLTTHIAKVHINNPETKTGFFISF